MDTIKWSAAAAAVIGAHHAHVGRNGQDAARAWTGDAAAAIVVCDGCSAGASSEVGARLGASLMIGALAARLVAGARPSDEAMWEGARGDVVRAIADVVCRMAGPREAAIHEHFLFTIVAAAASRDAAAVWAIGDGAYAFGAGTQLLGPFAGNQPPYVAYDLLGDAVRARFEPAPVGVPIVVATDGVAELGLDRFAARRFVAHPDRLRRELALLARPAERIDWSERRIARTPASLQDDAAVGVLIGEPS